LVGTHCVVCVSGGMCVNGRVCEWVLRGSRRERCAADAQRVCLEAAGRLPTAPSAGCRVAAGSSKGRLRQPPAHSGR
jgi:hypothetical protein